ncbi:hypothetical protein FKW77_000855 [Venturia effusa]|uniref:Uncharacterized protein n=1 Tax=Venturia effusa TaxID=50376 RepID=A0A517LPH8_9PEZI|nr:hypothetical protein FKW77_000855 [Venturia effusa]
MVKRDIEDVEPEVEGAAIPTSSKKRKGEDVVAPTREVRIRKKSAPRQEMAYTNESATAQKPVSSKKRKSEQADEQTKGPKVTKKRKVSATQEQPIINAVPIIHTDYEKWNVLRIIGRVTNAHFNSKWPIYCYELEGEPPRWSWDLAGSFKNPKCIKKMQDSFDKVNRLGTARLREGSDELEEACREHGVAPPAASGAPTIGLQDLNHNIFAWFGPDGYTSDEPNAKASVASVDAPKQVTTVENRPEASMRKKETTTKKSSIPLVLATSPGLASDVGEQAKISRQEVKKESLAPPRTASPEAINAEQDRHSARQRRSLRRNAAKYEDDSPPPKKRSQPKRMTEKERLQKKDEEEEEKVNQILQRYSNLIIPVESDFVYLVTDPPTLNRVLVPRDPAMKPSIVGLYRRQLAPAFNGATRTATYNPIYSRDAEVTVHNDLVEWDENESATFEVYLVKWTKTFANGGQSFVKGFVAAEHLEQHVDYFPEIESFEHESRAAIYKAEDEAAREELELKKEEKVEENH